MLARNFVDPRQHCLRVLFAFLHVWRDKSFYLEAHGAKPCMHINLRGCLLLSLLSNSFILRRSWHEMILRPLYCKLIYPDRRAGKYIGKKERKRAISTQKGFVTNTKKRNIRLIRAIVSCKLVELPASGLFLPHLQVYLSNPVIVDREYYP